MDSKIQVLQHLNIARLIMNYLQTKLNEASSMFLPFKVDVHLLLEQDTRGNEDISAMYYSTNIRYKGV